MKSPTYKKAGLFFVVLPFVLILLAISAFIGAVSYKATEEYYKAQPQKLLEKIQADGSLMDVPVVFFNASSRPEFTPLNGRSCVFYDRWNVDPTIYIRIDCFENSSQIIRYFWHEYGHHIWYEIINGSEQQAYIKIYSDEPVYVSDYAFDGGYMEDFADSYSYYKTGEVELPKARERYFKQLRDRHGLDKI